MKEIGILIVVVMFVAALSERWPKLWPELQGAIRVLAFILLLIVVPIALLAGGCLVTDAIISMHFLSTRDAAGFSEQKFATIRIGMSQDEVRRTLGSPLQISPKRTNVDEWWYTAPKELIDHWGTWDARYLSISNDRVVEVNRHIIMNH